MSLTIVQWIFNFVVSLCMFAMAFSNYKRNHKQDSTSSGEDRGTLYTEIRYIKEGVDDIKQEQKLQRAKFETHLDRMNEIDAKATEALASSKSAHKRIDRIDDILDRGLARAPAGAGGRERDAT